MREQRLVQELQHGTLLQPQGLHDGEDALDEAAAVFTMTTERVLSPQHARAQQALDMIVGRLDTFFACKGPQRRLDGQQVVAKGRYLGILAGAPQLQPLMESLAHRRDLSLQLRTAQASATESVP